MPPVEEVNMNETEEIIFCPLLVRPTFWLTDF